MTHTPAITPPVPQTFVPPSTGDVIPCRKTLGYLTPAEFERKNLGAV